MSDNVEVQPGEEAVGVDITLHDVRVCRYGNGNYRVESPDGSFVFHPGQVVAITRPRPTPPETVRLGDRWVLQRPDDVERLAFYGGLTWYVPSEGAAWKDEYARSVFVRVFTDDDPLRAET